MTLPWFNFAVAILLGLLIGLERERSKGQGPGRRPAGIRTFALATLVGAIAIHLGGVLLLAIATGGVAVLTALSYVYGHEDDPGLTTEVGLMAAPLLGGLAMSDTPPRVWSRRDDCPGFRREGAATWLRKGCADRRRGEGRPYFRDCHPCGVAPAS